MQTLVCICWSDYFHVFLHKITLTDGDLFPQCGGNYQSLFKSTLAAVRSTVFSAYYWLHVICSELNEHCKSGGTGFKKP